MNKIRYELTSAPVHVSEDTELSYGIRCFEDDVEKCCFADVLPDKHQVEKLVEICNELSLDPIHLPDVIEDFLP